MRRLTILLLTLLAASASHAHELGKIQVYATFLKDGTYRIDIPVDPTHLWPGDKGAGAAGGARYGPIRGLTPEVDQRFGKFLRTLTDNGTILFDGAPVQPRVEIVPPAADDPPERATLRLRGPIPAGSRSFNWKEEGALGRLGTYPLILLIEGEESSTWQWLDAGATSPDFSLAKAAVPPTRSQVVRQYLTLGFTHIVPEGPDHILFVLGIFLLSRRLKPILQQVTAFTVAHTLTLALSIYGVVRLSPSIVEPLIALSIVFVAVENILVPELRPSRIALVFCFGLLHGLGFAGVLSEMGLPRSELLTALLSFNLGVEGGQLAVISIAFLLVGLPFRRQAWYRQRVVVPASCLIAAVGLYWSVQRVFF
ncbi:MAG: HupE/UreJ family protein [Thermoanaerobaculia bacterium]